MLSFYDITISELEIKKALPKHTFGNTIEEIPEYLTSIGINNILRERSADLENNIQDKPMIVNIDLNKILGISDKRIPLYIILLKEKVLDV